MSTWMPDATSDATPSIAAPSISSAPTHSSTLERVNGRPLFVTAIGLSAFLLFTLELLAGRLVLPVFGGTPAVWTTALCFFTGIVFLGYLYAHVVVTRLGQGRGEAVHLVVAGLIVVATFLAPSDLGALRLANMPEAINVLLVLALIVGAPAFLLATTSPLLSAWFAGRGGDPWWLYAASNGASLVGLLAYPFVIEPNIPLSGQRVLLTMTLVLFGITLTAVVARGRRIPIAVHRPAIVVAQRLARRRQILWLIAAFIPAGLLSATTTYLATDLVSAPLLWVGPLAIYLASFVIAFSARGRRILPIAERLVPAAATLMWIPYVLPASWPVVALVAFLLASYAVIAIAVHGRLALDRPEDAHLTGFYLIVSLGGLLATAFVALVAPIVFDAVYEYPVLLVAGLCVLAVLPGPGKGSRAGSGAMIKEGVLRLAPFLAAGVALAVLGGFDQPTVAAAILLIAAIGAAIILLSITPRVLAIGTAVAIVTIVSLGSTHPLLRVRTFFGVVEVREGYDGLARTEFSGTTLHGLQFRDSRRSEPTTYYVRSGPLGDAMDDLAERLPDGGSVAVVGLGVGTVAAYERPGDTMTFFEIDPAVIDIAHDTHHFTYLADAPNAAAVVLGDARLSLARESDASFDLIVLDAFSSDAVPAHLLTREAITTYRRTLRPGGVIAFHLSNRFYDLAPAVASTARSLGLEAAQSDYAPSDDIAKGLAARPTTWVVAGQKDDTARFTGSGWSDPRAGPVLTDDFSDILRLLRIR